MKVLVLDGPEYLELPKRLSNRSPSHAPSHGLCPWRPKEMAFTYRQLNMQPFGISTACQERTLWST